MLANTLPNDSHRQTELLRFVLFPYNFSVADSEEPEQALHQTIYHVDRYRPPPA